MIKPFAVAIALLSVAFFTFPSKAEPQSVANQRYVFQLSYSDAEDAISEALRQKGAGDKIAAFINGRSNEPLYAFAKPLSVEIRGLHFEKSARRWNASLIFISDGEVVTAIPASGHFDEMIEVPVLKREVRNGDIIGEGDIEVHDFPMTHTRTDTITDISALIGKSPVRSISPQRPIREHEIASPAIIKKNAVVQMHYRSPGMDITATGQAMNDGAKGDVIDAKNTVSRKIIRVVIESADSVSIVAPGAQTSQLTGESHATNN